MKGNKNKCAILSSTSGESGTTQKNSQNVQVDIIPII